MRYLLLAGMLGTAGASAGPRAEGQSAEDAGSPEVALAAYERCTEEGGRDARFCEARLAVLRPQAADGFAGWKRLEAVRRAYRTLGSEAATAEVEAALAAHPRSPAAADMRRWLLNEYRRQGDEEKLLRMEAELSATTASAGDLATVERLREERGQAGRRRLAQGVGGGAFGLFLVAAVGRGRGPWLWRPAVLGAALVGGVPAVMAWLYDNGYGDGFLWTLPVVFLGVAAARRVPLPLSLLGTWGGFLAVAASVGWWEG